MNGCWSKEVAYTYVDFMGSTCALCMYYVIHTVSEEFTSSRVQDVW